MNRYRYPFLDVRKINLPYSSRMHSAFSDFIDSGRYIGGRPVEYFERDLARLAGTRYAVGVSNGLDALRLIFKGYIELGRLRHGDAVLVPANTYIASVLAVSDAGLKPVFVDADAGTMNMDTSLIESAVTPEVKAILTVHLYGRPCYDTRIKAAAAERGLLVVEDNAQAIGAVSATPSENGNCRTGGLGDAAAFSFYPTKNIGALGDAGAVTTDDTALAEAIRALANYGSDRRYHNIYKGYNCRLDPIQAALLSIKLKDLDEVCRKRRRIADIYNTNIDNPYIICPTVDAGSVWHQYVVRSDNRDELRDYLADNGVETDIHYPVPPHLQPCYREYSDLKLPVAERLADTILSLPIGSVSEEDALEIARIINGFRPEKIEK